MRNLVSIPLPLAVIAIVGLASAHLTSLFLRLPFLPAWLLTEGGSLLVWVVSLLLVVAFLARAVLHWMDAGAFLVARAAAIQVPWGDPPPVLGPWGHLEPLPVEAARTMPPVGGTTESVLAADGLGPLVLIERNDAGLFLVTRVGVDASVSRWIFVLLARNEVRWLEDGKYTPLHLVLTRRVRIVEIGHDGARRKAWEIGGDRLPASYLPAAGPAR